MVASRLWFGDLVWFARSHGKAIKDKLWEATRATTTNRFTEAMGKMQALDINVFAWLGDKEPSEWSRSHFNCFAMCDMLTNNISECFNSMIVDAREYPLIACLEKLRTIFMTRLFTAEKWTGIVCPNIVKKLAKEEHCAGGYLSIQCGLWLFEISSLHKNEHHKVDLQKRTCSCRKWDLTELPCRHAIRVIWHKKLTVTDYVDNCYKIKTYLKVYGGSIKPMAGPNEWPMTHRQPPFPPLYKSKPGRPCKLRKKGLDEISKDGIHVSRKHVPLNCTICRKQGHNLRKCPLNPKPKKISQTKRVRPQMQTNSEPKVVEELHEVPVGGEGSTSGPNTLI